MVGDYFNWIWIHSSKKNKATMRARLSENIRSWYYLITYLIVCSYTTYNFPRRVRICKVAQRTEKPAFISYASSNMG